MYQHILLPTDGSALSKAALTAGIAFAWDAGAAVFGCHVVTRTSAWLSLPPA